MKDLPLSRFKEHLNKKSFEIDVYEDLVRVLEESVVVNSKYYYPKNLFIPEKPLEVIFFNEKSATIIIVGENGKIDLEVKKYSSAESVKLETIGRHHPVVLRIRFTDGYELTLNPKEDTITNWVNRYSNHVKNIFKMFQI